MRKREATEAEVVRKWKGEKTVGIVREEGNLAKGKGRVILSKMTVHPPMIISSPCSIRLSQPTAGDDRYIVSYTREREH